MSQSNIKKCFFLFVFPTLISFLVAFAIPFVMGFYLSFTEFTTVSDAVWVGLDNYIRAFSSDGDFIASLWFTVKFSVVSVLSVNILAFAFALLLTRGLKGTNFFRTVFFMPNLIGGIVLGYLWQLILNGILQPFGVTLTSNAAYGFWGLIILTNWQMIGYMMIISVAGIQSIPDDLNEAASIDGVNFRQRIRHITIPTIMPSITICTFLTLTNSFKLFDQNLALTAGAPSKQTQMLALDIYNTFYGRAGWEGVGQAKAVLFSLFVAAIAIIQQRLTAPKSDKLRSTAKKNIPAAAKNISSRL